MRRRATAGAAALAALVLAVTLAVPPAATAAPAAPSREAADALLAEARAAGPDVSADEGAVLADGLDGLGADPVAAGGLASRLRDADAAVRASAAADLAAYLGSLRAVAGDAPAVAVSPDAAVLDEILAKQVVDTRSPMSEAIRLWVDRALDAIVRWWTGAAGRSGAGRSLALLVGFAVVALVLAFVAWRVAAAARARAAVRDAAASGAGPAGAAVVAAAEGLPADASGFAESLAASGRTRDAVRALFGGAARTLVERGVVPQTRTRTDGELLADVSRAAPPVAPPLSELTGAFELAWYGHVEPGEDGYAGARSAYERTLAEVGEMRP